MYIWEQKEWPHFHWDETRIGALLAGVRHQQGRLLGMAEMLGFDVKSPVMLDAMVSDVIKSSEIEGIALNADDVRSSVAWQMGIDSAGVPTSDRYIEGIVDVMFDAIHNSKAPLTKERLCKWHSSLFPNPSRLLHVVVGDWRQSDAPMQVVSGRYGKEKVHYEAPPSRVVAGMMDVFLLWINAPGIDPMLKAAVAHLWFVTIHPFSDGNGRLARTISDMLLSQSDGTANRFYSMSAQIAKSRVDYYNKLEQTQKGSLDITGWLVWFLSELKTAIDSAIVSISHTLKKAIFWEQHRHVAMNERQTKMINMLWDGFDGKLTTSKWAKINKCSTDTALRDIQDLEAKGILVRSEAGGRSTGYEMRYS